MASHRYKAVALHDLRDDWTAVSLLLLTLAFVGFKLSEPLLQFGMWSGDGGSLNGPVALFEFPPAPTRTGLISTNLLQITHLDCIEPGLASAAENHRWRGSVMEAPNLNAPDLFGGLRSFGSPVSEA